MKIGIFTDTYNPTVSGVVTSINMLEKELNLFFKNVITVNIDISFLLCLIPYGFILEKIES